jgi:hypothetical protein
MEREFRGPHPRPLSHRSGEPEGGGEGRSRMAWAAEGNRTSGMSRKVSAYGAIPPQIYCDVALIIMCYMRVYSRSMTVAMPWPTPMHIVASP